MKIAISIIVPVYNVERYLERCLSSIVNQTLKNIEIIIVDDGSTDKSTEIISEFIKNDVRIKAINQKNNGVSAARNIGINIACGEYIGFVDSDDYIEKEMYEEMYNKAKISNSEMVVCNVNDIVGDKISKSLDINNEIIDIDYVNIDKFLEGKYFKLGSAVWHKIFKKSLIDDNDIRFVNYSKVSSEDTLFNFQCMLKSKKILCIDNPMYNYVVRAESLSNGNHGKVNMIERSKNTIKVMNRYCEDNNINQGCFIDYITYNELINSLYCLENIDIKSIAGSIQEYSQNKHFYRSTKLLVFTNKLDKYFISHKGSYEVEYKLFDKLFGLTCLFKIYRISSILHYFRVKRASKLQEV